MRSHPQPPMNPKLFAKTKVMDMIARRDHSEDELRSKVLLAFRQSFAEEVDAEMIHVAIEEALEVARAKGWLQTPAVLAEKTAKLLHGRHKGIEYINNYLQAKGLPEVAVDDDLELEKALALVKNKMDNLSEMKLAEKEKEQARIARFLTARGFDSETVRKVIYEKL